MASLFSFLTSELCCSIDVVDKVPSSVGCVSYLPAVSQRLKVSGVNINVSESWVVPGTDTSRSVDEIDLALGRGPLFYTHKHTDTFVKCVL